MNAFPRESKPPRQDWRRMLGFGLLFLALSLGVPYAIQRELGGQWPGLDARLLQVEFLLACLAILLVYFASDGLRLWFLTRSLGYRIPARQITPLVFINVLVANVTPMGAGGGLAQIWYLRHLGMPVGAATAAATLRTLLASLGIFLPALFLLWFRPVLAGRFLDPGWAYGLGLLAAIYLAGFALVFWRLRWVLGWLKTLLSTAARWRWISVARQRRWYFTLRRETVRFAVAMRIFAHCRGVDFWLAVISTAIFLLSLFCIPALLLWGMGYPVAFFDTLGLSNIVIFVMYFAPTPGAAGVAEGVFGLLFASQVAGKDLLTLVLGWRFLTVHLAMLLGIPLLAYFIWRGRRRES